MNKFDDDTKLGGAVDSAGGGSYNLFQGWCFSAFSRLFFQGTSKGRQPLFKDRNFLKWKSIKINNWNIFSIFINDLEDEIACTFSTYSGHTKMGRMDDRSNGCAVKQEVPQLAGELGRQKCPGRQQRELQSHPKEE